MCSAIHEASLIASKFILGILQTYQINRLEHLEGFRSLDPGPEIFKKAEAIYSGKNFECKELAAGFLMTAHSELP